MEQGTGLPPKKELWAFRDNRIAVPFVYAWHDDSGQWYRSNGNENREVDELGYMNRHFASINDLAIKETDRKFRRERPVKTWIRDILNHGGRTDQFTHHDLHNLGCRLGANAPGAQL